MSIDQLIKGISKSGHMTALLVVPADFEIGHPLGL
jgi:hypothetical protein